MLSLFRPAVITYREHRDGFTFEPAHADYYKGPVGANVKRLLHGRRDFLSIWRKADYSERITRIRVLGRDILLINSPEHIRDVVNKRHHIYERKSPQMRRALEYLLGDGLFISDGETWRNRRALVSDIVHASRVPSFGPMMEQAARELVTRWLSLGDGASVNILSEMAGLTAEIISRAVFGNQLGETTAEQVSDSFTSYQSLIDSINLGYFCGFDEGLPVWRSPSLRRSVRQLHSIIDKVVEDHLAGRGDHNSMVELLIRRQQRSPDLKLDVIALRNEAATIFMAGHETTAATLTWAFYLLSRADWADRAVQAEIEQVCGDRAPTVADVPQLEYCRAVIEETLRLYPPVPILARQNNAEDTIGDFKIRKGSLVLMVPWLLHRTPSLFPEPHLFKPERFLNGQRPAPYSYIPFASGPRVCPGLQFGLTEAVLCLATLAQRFRIHVDDHHTVEPVCRLTLRPRGGLPARLALRQNFS